MKNRVLHVLWVLLLPGFFGAPPVTAQVLSDPGTLQRTLPTQSAEPPTGQPVVDIPEPIQQTGLPVPGSFVLGAVILDGNTVFDPAVLAQDFEALLASRVSNAELLAIAERITQRYRRAGYPFSYAMIPEQEIRSGIVRIRVVEGFISEVKFTGAGGSTRALSVLARPIVKERPLRGKTLERAVGLMKDIPGVAISDIQINRSDVEPARLTMTIAVSNDEVQGLIYLDNRGTHRSARKRLYSNVSLSSLLTSGDRVKADFFSIPGAEYHFLHGQLDASVPIAADGFRIGATVSVGDYSQELSGQHYAGASRGLATYATYPIRRGRAEVVLGSLSLNDWQSEADFGGLPVLRDRLQVARLSIQLKSWETETIDALFTISKGLDLGNATPVDDPLASRTGARPSFIKLNFDMKIARPINDRITLRLGASGQYATHPLLSAEEYAVGGARFGRAFDYNTLTGDHGIGAATEIGYRVGDLGRDMRQLELFGAIDGGAVFRINPVSGADYNELVGVTAGWRMVLLGLASSLELGVPISGPNGQHGVRGFFTLAKQFN